MKIGFIGAGKVGTSLGQYLTECKTNIVSISGYWSRDPNATRYACEKTNSSCFSSLEEIARVSDILFLTVSDSVIETVWQQLSQCPLQGKIICHCSGVETSRIFQSNQADLYRYSIHPLLAIHSKNCSPLWQKAHLTLEGDEKYLSFWKEFFLSLGNETTIISPENKAKYHAAAVFSTNLVLATLWEGISLFKDCGFTQEVVEKAIYPMICSNIQTMTTVGIPNALTGPVSRGDVSTIDKHLGVLSKEEQALYIRLSQVLLPIAKEKDQFGEHQEAFQTMKALFERNL